LDAVEWLGRHKGAAAVPAITKYLDRTLADMEKTEDSLKRAEISEPGNAATPAMPPPVTPTSRSVRVLLFE
jgi:hypothetical protein